jgi:hypothetical protein
VDSVNTTPHPHSPPSPPLPQLQQSKTAEANSKLDKTWGEVRINPSSAAKATKADRHPELDALSGRY